MAECAEFLFLAVAAGRIKRKGNVDDDSEDEDEYEDEDEW